MTLTADKVHGGMDIIDLLLKNTDEFTSCYSNQSWIVPMDDALGPEHAASDDFFGALLHGSDSSSVPASPLWSPCTTDSGISEDAPTDPAGSPHATAAGAPCAAFPRAVPPPPSVRHQQARDDVCIDLDLETGKCHMWCCGGKKGRGQKKKRAGRTNTSPPNQSSTRRDLDCGRLGEESEILYYLTANQNPLQPSSHALTVKDLLLSNLGPNAQRIPQHALQELVLNEDEKKLLAKEGVSLPSKLPLSKFEERVLKKIRRKIRNKRSAQESRKKKRDYVDSLEGRMSTCSAHNLELQRKIYQLEETNSALLEQLSQLQALLPNSTSRKTHKGTCILVLLLSFSLLISSNLQPDPYGPPGPADYAETKVSSRSLQAVGDARVVPPPVPPPCLPGGSDARRGLTEKLEPRVVVPTAGCSPAPHRDHRHRDDH